MKLCPKKHLSEGSTLKKIVPISLAFIEAVFIEKPPPLPDLFNIFDGISEEITEEIFEDI